MTVLGWTVLIIGGSIAVRGLLQATLLATHGGKAEATGRVVEHREGKRPTIVEFTPAEGAGPVRFKDGTLREIGSEVDVLYSVLDPRNAQVNRFTARDARKAGAATAAVGLVIAVVGVVLLLL